MAYFSVEVDTDGAGDGITTFPTYVKGVITSIRIDYAAGALASTDVTIAETVGMKQTILDPPATNVADIYYPVTEVQTIAGAGLGSYVPFYTQAPLEVTVTGAATDTEAAVIVTVQFAE